MKVSTLSMTRSLRRARVLALNRRARAAHLRTMRETPAGARSLRIIHTAAVRPCPACGRPYDPSILTPPHVAAGVACACCHAYA